MLNVSFNALDRHVLAGRGEATALVYDSAVLGIQRRFSYSELLDQVATFAGVLRSQGVGQGDRVLIYLPMIPQAHIAMLACARIGAVHSVVFGGFAPKELAARIDDATPKAIVTATGGIEPTRRVEYLPAIADAMEQAAHHVPTVIVAHRDGFAHERSEYAGGDTAWHDWDELASAAQPVDAVPVASTHPLYILYTSGTTGSPKGVVRDSGGYAVAMDWSMRNIYGVGPGDTMLTASDVGWVVGHSYIVYGPLIAGATTVLYEGKPVGTPDAGAFWRLIDDHKVDVFFTAPTALRAIRKADPDAELLAEPQHRKPQGTLCRRGTPGPRHLPVGLREARRAGGRQLVADRNRVADRLQPGGPGTPGTQGRFADGPGARLPGGNPRRLRRGAPGGGGRQHRHQAAAAAGNPGHALGQRPALHRHLPPAFPGYYTTGDSGYLDADGYLFVMGRTDDVINVSGTPAVHRRHGTGAWRASRRRRMRGHRGGGRAQGPAAQRLRGAQERRRDRRGATRCANWWPWSARTSAPWRTSGRCASSRRLPKTRSGKILRKTMRQIADGKAYSVPSTIEDPSVIDALIPLLRPTA